MARQLKDGFLKAMIRFNAGTEIPDFYAVWAGISAISACLSRKCFVKFRPILYPNLYVIFVAESALCHKTTAIDYTEELLSYLKDPPQAFAQKGTPVGLIRLFANNLKIEGKHDWGAQGILIADELKTLLDHQAYMSGLITLLTKLFDSQGRDFNYVTAGHGVETIKDSCLSLLGGITLKDLRQAVPSEAFGGGYTSRCIFVLAKQTDIDVSWPEETNEQSALLSSLTHDLNIIRNFSGEFKPTAKAKKLFDKIYRKFRTDGRQNRYGELGGYLGRRGPTLIKLMMSVSASRKDTMTLDESDVEIANDLLCQTEIGLPTIIQHVLSNREGEQTNEVLQIIRTEGEVARASILRTFSHNMRASELDSVIQTLIESDLVAVRVQGRSLIYSAKTRKEKKK